MNRRDMLTGAFKVACATAPVTVVAAGRAAAAGAEFGKAVYHLSDLDKVDFVFGNIRNHYNGMGGPDHVTIALVVLGPALQSVPSRGSDARHRQEDRGTEKLRASAERLHQHYAGAECYAQGAVTGLYCRREGRRCAARRIAVAGLRLSAAVTRAPSLLRLRDRRQSGASRAMSLRT